MSEKPAHDDSERRLRRLLEVSNDLTRRLDLPILLHRIAEVAVELVGARYGALGVIGADRRLEQFIHVGIDPELARSIGHLPEGKGLLGRLIDDARPVRLSRLSDDPLSSGIPDHHPKMDSFLGVPIRVGDEVFGNLYLTESENGQFSAEDQDLVMALASTAGAAIETARLFDDAAFTARWSSELAEISKQALQEGPDSVDADQLAERAGVLADADLTIIKLVSADGSAIDVLAAAGATAAEYVRSAVPAHGSLAFEAVRAGEPVLLDDCDQRPEFAAVDPGLKYALAVPFAVADRGHGVLAFLRSQDKAPFKARDVDLARAFARHVVTAIERESIREDRRQLALLDERTRIARDLHDHVIQRLFAVGLNVQATASQLSEDVAKALGEQVVEIDSAIAQIRQSIFALSATGSAKERIRSRVLDIVDRFQGRLEQPVTARFLGPVDLLSDSELTDDVVAVVTEALTNAVRHAAATTVSVAVTAGDGHIVVEVEDNGQGLPADVNLSGLANMRARAQARDGDLEVGPATKGGTRLRWRSPLA